MKNENKKYVIVLKYKDSERLLCFLKTGNVFSETLADVYGQQYGEVYTSTCKFENGKYISYSGPHKLKTDFVRCKDDKSKVYDRARNKMIWLNLVSIANRYKSHPDVEFCRPFRLGSKNCPIKLVKKVGYSLYDFKQI